MFKWELWILAFPYQLRFWPLVSVASFTFLTVSRSGYLWVKGPDSGCRRQIHAGTERNEGTGLLQNGSVIINTSWTFRESVWDLELTLHAFLLKRGYKLCEKHLINWKSIFSDLNWLWWGMLPNVSWKSTDYCCMLSLVFWEGNHFSSKLKLLGFFFFIVS